MLFKFLLILFLANPNQALNAQEYHDFGFEPKTDIPVFDPGNKLLDLAWCGGLNAAQFHRFDLNFNGVEDLIIFDRHGNRLLTFLNDGSEDEYAFTFAPEYARYFPPLSEWVQFIDYNGDGKKDIFTYTTGGIKVFRNISDTIISFEQVTFPFLLTKIGNNFVNLFVTNVDYPAITDMDGDGDLDILTFWSLGTFLEMHTNKSTEIYGHSDSLIFEKSSYCWGFFAESDESNQITLDTCVNFKGFKKNELRSTSDELRHVGSTLLTLDMTGNGLKDLILGDTDYPGLYLLKNGGSADSARIIGFDTLFPSNTRPVRLFSMPATHFVDVTNNGVNDLLVSPFTPSLRQSKHHRSAWFYRNTGTNDLPVFEFEREDIFQHRMIDVGAGSMPVFADVNNDGLPDLVIGNYGYNDTCYFDQNFILRCKYSSRLAYYINTGSAGEPEFTLANDDFAELSALGLLSAYPTFGDLNNDGSPEMLVGNSEGSLLLFQNRGKNKGQPEYQLVDNNFQSITVSGFSKPQLIDLNGNGLLDLVIGQQNGKISFYENQGTATVPVFVKIADELGGVNVTDPMFSYTGHSIPHFFRDSQNELKLFVGSESGRIFYYTDIEANLEGTFTLAEERLLLIDEGIYTAPAVELLTGSIYPDLIIGNYGGGLSFYKGSEPLPFGIKKPVTTSQIYFDVFPNPASSQLTLTIKGVEFRQANLQVFDFTGRLVLSKELKESSVTISVQDWKPGLYIFKVLISDRSNTMLESGKKVIIH